ncbi:histone-lysine N-methyltransferase PRDM9-like isoform X2 [Coregonus clupeaformis]|uniref:histone-lysine N-methyltransferase PRDM9-like isoform X2 n=1 Tax=Coregonus clupeaformis TaxID=59861 RepID=UPI001E1C3D08|nr:histone-lysine N-methyltransferase PRDM9-like isoform X2 [Coregonus clupeaformis]
MSEEVIIMEWAAAGASEEGCQAQLITVFPDSLVQNVLVNTVVQGQEEDHPLLDDNGNDLYCEECHASDKDQCDIQGGLSFMLDSPTPMGLPQRALLTLPHGLVVGRSSIPGAGLGVLNQGAVVAPGMHFGPCEGEVTTRDSAVTSDYSWEVWNSKGESEYIDSARDTHSNWMRYVNCARSVEEGNLIALQYRGIVFFHCCRSILPGDELLFWPGGRFIDRFRDPSDQIWLRKSTPSDLSSQVFLCSQCQLSFTTETYFQRHKEQIHPLDLSPASALSELDNHLSNGNMDPDPMSSSLGELGYRCPQRPKSFKQKGHVQRNMQAVNSVRPYCCPQCRKCFAQVYVLARHQLRVHGTKKKRGVVEVRGESSLPPPSDSAWEPKPPSIDPPTETQTGRAPLQRLSNLRVKSIRNSKAKTNTLKQRETIIKKRSHSDAPDMEEERDAVGEAQYRCTDCQRTYGNPESLKAHQCIPVVVGPQPYSCTMCGVTFKRYTTLKKHKLNKHPKEKMLYCCTHCGRFFSQAAGLQRHLEAEVCKNIQLSSKAVPCSYCQFSFTEERFLRKHVKRHHPDEYVSQASGLGSGLIQPEQKAGEAGEVHLCLQCGKSYEYIQSFKAHRCFQSVTAKLHLCNDCGKGFSCFYSLKQHQRIHTGEKPYRCHYCEKCFSHSGHLNVHMRIHTGEKSFLCTECGESFRQSGDLKRHERKHTGVKPCTCPECGKSFSRPQSLKAHLMLHNGERQYKCDQCGKSFSRNYHLTRHHEKTHS